MQKHTLIFQIFIFSLLALPGYSKPPAASDSIKWAYEKIELGKNNKSDTTFATVCFKEALRIGIKTNNPQLMERAHFWLGYQYFWTDNKKMALYHCRKAIEQNKLGSESTNIYNMFYLIAQVHYKNDDYGMALDSLTVAEEYAIKDNNVNRLLRSYGQRITIYSYLNQLDLATELLKKAINLSIGEKDTPFLHNFYARTADIARNRKQYNRALKYYKKANKILKGPKFIKGIQRLSFNYNQIGNIHFILKQFHLAREYYLKSIKNSNNNNANYSYSITLTHLVKLETELGNFDKAFDYLNQLDLLGKTNDKSILIHRFIQTGNLYNKLNELDSSLYYYKSALNLAEQRKAKLDISRFRVGFNSQDYTLNLKIGEIYKGFYDETRNIVYFDSLFKYANNYRSRSLFENSESKITTNESYQTTVNEIEKLHKDIRFWQNSNNDVTAHLDQLKYSLVSKRLEFFKEKVSDFKSINREEFQNYLAKNNSCAVIYSVNEQNQYALYLDKNRFDIIDLTVSPDILQIDIKQFLSSAFYQEKIKDFEYLSPLAYKLYLSLWKPIEENFDCPQNVIIIPDQSILNLPFDILLNNETEKQVYSINDKPTYLKSLLIQKYNFSYLPSANLVKAFKTPNENKEILLIANPSFKDEYKISPIIRNHTGWAFDPLLYSELEIQSIKKIFKKALVFKGEDAVKSRFINRLSSSNIIHFATHAFVDTVYDLFSGLVLSMPKDSSDNGFFLGYEIDQLNLNCDLVALSACESGRGKIISAEGVMGLPRLFFSAGARSVLMTLWKIDDMQSTKLMSNFYDNILTQNLSITEALGESKRKFLNTDYYQKGIYYSYPFYWAAFNLYGDVGNITVLSDDDNLQNSIAIYALVFLAMLILIYIYKRNH